MTITAPFEPGCLTTDTGRALPLVSLTGDAVATGLHATWTLVQSYHNDTDDTVEVTYTFPLPGRFATGAFTFTCAGRRIVGELRERGEARATYDDAVATGLSAALLEEDRPEVFTVSLGNVPAGADAEVELQLVGPVPVVDGQADLRLPTVVAERHVAGTPTGTTHGTGEGLDTDLVPDASRVTPPHSSAASVTYTITVTTDSKDRPDVPDAFIVAGEAGAWTVTNRGGQSPDGDVHVRWPVSSGRGPTAVAQQDDQGVTVAVTLVGDDEPDVRPRDVAIVLDRSGSMGTGSMEVARRAAARMADSLNESDRLAVIGFDTEMESPWPGLRPATDDTRFEAVRFLSALEARGGTDIARALADGLSRLAPAPGRDLVLVLVTDALVAGEDHTLRAVKNAGVCVHGVCIGRHANAGLLDKLAGATGGASVVVDTNDQLDAVLDGLRRRVAPPVWRDVRIDAGDTPLTEASPRHGDVHAGTPTVISGRADHMPESVTVTATGRDGRTASWQAPVHAVDNQAVHASWARGRVRDLEDLRVLGGDDAPTAEAIVAFSLTHTVLCRFTAFVAVDTDGEPVEVPAGRTTVQPAGQGVFNLARSMTRGVSGASVSSLATRSINHSGSEFACASPAGSLGDGMFDTGSTTSRAKGVPDNDNYHSPTWTGLRDGWPQGTTWPSGWPHGTAGPVTPANVFEQLAALCDLLDGGTALLVASGMIDSVTGRLAVVSAVLTGLPDTATLAGLVGLLSASLAAGDPEATVANLVTSVRAELAARRDHQTGPGVFWDQP
jgi:Ca-activated chloride channel family protein